MKIPINNTEKGNNLRNAVFNLVKIAQKSNCSIEQSIDGKKVDVYYEDTDNFRRKKIKYGVECKYYGRPLARSDYERIIASYMSALTSKAIDYLIIITDLSPTSGLLDSFANSENIIHHTFENFSSIIMDFSRYTNSMVSMFNNDGLSDYYVPIKDVNNRDIEDSIDQWVNSENSTPMAILAGYGMGKTSLSIKLASKYAQKCITGDVSRIPIYLKLGDIFNEQGLEGLVCRYFSSKYSVPGFTYPLFLEFNRSGRFIIILDGFDEMKHAMSFSAFKSNIMEFNKLVVNKSKIIILGRPNAFTSEDEKMTVLHGLKYVGETEIRDTEMKNYNEIHVSTFCEDQLLEFIPKFVSYTASQDNIRRLDFVSDEFLTSRVSELLEEQHRELISRPVHAIMLVQIALGTSEPLSSFTTYHLYEAFFVRILEREISRPARKNINVKHREKFVEKLAWERWLKGGSRVFSFSDIEKISLDLDIENLPKADILRDLVIGSVVESKGDDYYYFAHRSFQEFLVTKHILHLEWSTNSIPEIDRALGSNVVDFINQSGKKHEFVRHLNDQIRSYTGEISSNLLKILENEIYPANYNTSNIFSNPPIISSWDALIVCSSDHKAGQNNFNNLLFSTYIDAKDDSLKLAIFCGLAIRSLNSNYGKTILLMLDLMHYQLHRIIHKTHIHRRNINSFVIDNYFDKFILSSFLLASKSIFNDSDELTGVQINIKVLCEKLFDCARGQFYIFDFAKLYSSKTPEKVLVSIADIGFFLHFTHPILDDKHLDQINSRNDNIAKSRSKLRKFWGASPSANAIVPVRKQSEVPLKSRKKTLKMS